MDYPRSPSYIVIAYDATKDPEMHELLLAVHGVLKGGDIVRRGDVILVLGVLHRVTHPMGYQTIPCSDSKGTSIRAVKEAVERKVDGYVNMLLQIAKQSEDQGVSLEVKVTAGFPIKQVILQEIAASKAAWVVLDRHLKQSLGFYITHVPCKIALVEDTLEVEIVRPHVIGDTDKVKEKWFYSLSKRVPALDCGILNGNKQQAIISCGRRYFVSINSLENRILQDFPAATYIWAERDKKAHGRASTSARTNRDRLVQKERASRGGRIHLFIDQCLCGTEGQHG